MSEIIYLQLGNQICKLASISESIKGKKNDFIKICLIENSEIYRRGIIKVEYTIHPEKIARKEIISEKVIISGFGDKIHKKDSNYINYMDLITNIGFNNFQGNLLVVHQISFNFGFSMSKNKINFEDNVLKLEIEHDEPFWLGVLFCKKRDLVAYILNQYNIVEYKIIQLQKGFIIIAVRKLIPYWEKLKIPKGSEFLGKITWNEKFHLKTIC